MTTSDLVGLRIKTVRRQRGLSQAQLAHPELSDSYVSLIESGKRTPTPAVLELLAQKLDCSLSYLVNGVTAEQMQDIELALGYARLALENGEVSEARTRFAELLADNNLTGLAILRQDAELGLALATEACGDLEGAVTILNRLREEEAPLDRQIELAIALCRVYTDSARFTEAVEVAESVLGSSVRPTWTDLHIELGATLLAAYLYRGDLLRARQFAAELLNAADVLGTPRSQVAAAWNAAIVAESTGHGEDSLSFAQRALAVLSENGQPRSIARMRMALAGLMMRVRPQAAAEAHQLLVRAEHDLAQTSASVTDLANARVELARAEIMMGELEAAERNAVAGRDGLPSGAHPLRAEARLILSRAQSEQGSVAEARMELDSVREWLTKLPDSRRAAGTWYAAAETMERVGDEEGAVEAYRRALASVGL
ncbi:helix-turn-helix domain-containing protein [Nonomuraea sp. NBC_01738]|nr:helix-turn-helix domain-containing protein [Nonomuraea sp. NBC_01738]